MLRVYDDTVLTCTIVNLCMAVLVLRRLRRKRPWGGDMRCTYMRCT